MPSQPEINPLALNVTIEAARGFASGRDRGVKTADQLADATTRISAEIEGMQGLG